jgi:transcriptional regulator with XRE-family HTH domain
MASIGLRQARTARGWSQRRLVAGIEQYARQHGLTIASTASLGVYVSEWENGKRSISEEYAAILRAVLGLTADELLLPSVPPALTVDGYDELVARIDAAHSFGASVVDTLLSQTELLRTMDRQLGAPQLIDQMTAHLATLQDALTFAVLPEARRPVARALAGAATLAAWQALDVGAADRAWRHYELAKSAAREAEEPAFLAHAMGEQAYVLVDAGKPDLAIILVREALRIGGRHMPPRLVAWLRAVEAELCALAGRADECRRALDRATDTLPDGNQARDPDMPSIFLNHSHLTRWRGNALALLGDGQAVTALRSALAAMDPTFVRAQAGLRCDLAEAHFYRGEYDEAAMHLKEARRLASRTGSVRHRRRIERLTHKM